MEIVSTKFLSDYNGTCQDDNSQYLHWLKLVKMTTAGYLQWRKFRQNDRFLNSNAHESPFHNLQMTPANASHSDWFHYNNVVLGAMASQITSLMIVCSTGYSGADQRKHQSSASLAFVRGIHRWPGNSPHKWPLTRKMFSFDDVIMSSTAGI